MTNKRHLVMVEGSNDLHATVHLAARGGLSQEQGWEVTQHGGVEALLARVPLTAKTKLRSLAIVVDADQDPMSRWQSLRTRLHQAEIVGVPDEIPAGGLIIQASARRPAIGVWLMPDNINPGAIEDLLLEMCGDADLKQHATHSVQSIPETSRRFDEKDARKALIATWLAWQRNPGQPYGTALKSPHVFNHDTPGALAFTTWLCGVVAAGERT